MEFISKSHQGEKSCLR